MELICLKNQNCNQKQKGVYEMKSKMKKTVAIIATVAAVLSFAAITVSAKHTLGRILCLLQAYLVLPIV